MTKQQPDIVVAWDGLPIYAARCIEYCRKTTGLNILVLYTRPSVPITGLENYTACALREIDPKQPVSWVDLGIARPRVFIHTGWSIHSFMGLAEEVRRGNGQVVAMVDNCWKGTFRQKVGALYFRLKLRALFDALWVPGASGRKLAKIFGMPSDRVFTGLYGMDPAIFSPGRPLLERRRELIFVGRLIPRKGLSELLTAFTDFSHIHPDWTLRIIGDGPLRALLPDKPQIQHHPFSPPEAVAQAMRDARALVLPSREEHWGLVVHEAALSGCSLLLSDRVGAHPDLLQNNRNGLLFRAGNPEAIRACLERYSQWDNAHLRIAQETSLELANHYGPKHFYDSFAQIIQLHAKGFRKK